MEPLKLVSGSKPGYVPLDAENSRSVTFCFLIAYVQEKINSLVSVLNICFFLFYDVNLNTQDLVYLEFVKYQLDLHRNMPVFAKCNVYISAKKLFYIQECPNCLPIQKKNIYLSDCRASHFLMLQSVLGNI